MEQIDLDSMKQLIGMMVDNELTELQYRQGELSIELKRGGPTVVTTVPAGVVSPMAAPPIPSAPAVLPTKVDEFAGLVAIKSPMVGTFYAQPDPESPPFVNIGARVGVDSTVCVIEAMKVFNEIKAEVNGTIERIMVTNAQAVEYGQALFYVRPS